MRKLEVIAKLLVIALMVPFAGCGGSYGNNSAPNTSATKTLIGGSVQGTPLSLNGNVSTFAGTASTIGSTDGTGTDARFNSPHYVTTDGNNLYVADWSNHTIRKVVIATGAVSTIAGTAGNVGSTDGVGAASFNFPWGITTDGTNLYVAEYGNHSIRKIVIATGTVSTLAATIPSGAAAYFYHPAGITIDGTNLYIAEYDNHTISKLELITGVVTTVAGTALTPGTADGIGTAALFHNPSGITTDGTNLYVTDFYNHTIRKIVIATGAVTTMAGVAGSVGSVDGIGTAAVFKYPRGITSDGKNIYVTGGDNKIRKIEIASSTVSTIAGIAGIGSYIDGTKIDARFAWPEGITTDGTSLYVTEGQKNTIRKVQ